MARVEFTQAGEMFSRIAREIDSKHKLKAGEQSGDANLIVRIYGFAPPRSYSHAFEILATVMGEAAVGLQKVKIGGNGDETLTYESMYSLRGVMVRPGGVHRAIATLLNNP
jgi:hypothetical protein